MIVVCGKANPIAQADFDRIKPIVEKMDRRLGLVVHFPIRQRLRVRARQGPRFLPPDLPRVRRRGAASANSAASKNSRHRQRRAGEIARPAANLPRLSLGPNRTLERYFRGICPPQSRDFRGPAGRSEFSRPALRSPAPSGGNRSAGGQFTTSGGRNCRPCLARTRTRRRRRTGK